MLRKEFGKLIYISFEFHISCRLESLQPSQIFSYTELQFIKVGTLHSRTSISKDCFSLRVSGGAVFHHTVVTATSLKRLYSSSGSKQHVGILNNLKSVSPSALVKYRSQQLSVPCIHFACQMSFWNLRICKSYKEFPF